MSVHPARPCVWMESIADCEHSEFFRALTALNLSGNIITLMIAVRSFLYTQEKKDAHPALRRLVIWCLLGYPLFIIQNSLLLAEIDVNRVVMWVLFVNPWLCLLCAVVNMFDLVVAIGSASLAAAVRMTRWQILGLEIGINVVLGGMGLATGIWRELIDNSEEKMTQKFDPMIAAHFGAVSLLGPPLIYFFGAATLKIHRLFLKANLFQQSQHIPQSHVESRKRAGRMVMFLLLSVLQVCASNTLLSLVFAILQWQNTPFLMFFAILNGPATVFGTMLGAGVLVTLLRNARADARPDGTATTPGATRTSHTTTTVHSPPAQSLSMETTDEPPPATV